MKKLEKKKVKKVIIVLIVIVLLALTAFIANDYIIMDNNEKTSLVINNKNITANLKADVLIENDIIYLSKEDIANFFDKYIYLEKDSNQLITTYDKKIASIGFKENTLNINGANKKIYAHAENKNDKMYLPISEMKDVYGIEINYINESNTVTIDSISKEQAKAMICKDVAVKSSTGFISKTVDRTQNGTFAIIVSKSDNGWTKIRTKNGKIGYVKNDALTNEVKIRDNMDEEKQIEGKVNLVWDYYSQYVKAPDRSKDKIEGINVVSPSFFYINSKGEFKENIGDFGKEYIKWAHDNGYKIWPMITNSNEENMLEVTSAILNNYEKRNKLIQQIVGACEKYELDGINIDFENMKEKDKDVYSRFIIELTPQIKDTGKVISVDVTAPDGGETWSMCFDRNVIGNVADYIIFMAYDQTGVSSKKAGTTAGYNWVELNLKKFLNTEEIDSNKLILAIPFYTRLWTEESNGKVTSKVVNMKNIDEVIPKDAQKQWKDDEKQNYVEYTEKGNTKKIWIEDLKSIKEKMSLISKYNLAGVASWEKDREDEEVWKVIKEQLK